MSTEEGTLGPVCLQHPQVPATRSCERCGGPFCADCLVPLKGQILCGACKHASLSGAFQSYQVTVATRGVALPPQQTPVFTPPQTVALNSPCALHEHRDAVAVCERCGDFVCLLCLTPFEGRSYCLRCFDLLWERGEIASSRRRPPWHQDPHLALVGAIVSWVICFIPFISLLPAAGSVIIASLALSRRKKELKTGERAIAIAAIVLSVIAVGVSIALWISIYSHGD